ncbi:acyl-CoA dehydrogenase (plasmid) [Pseudorhodobacter turbinis]|uniref:Acyl-CoA dehydrogenase n=1 Tax=Pseudorhodobacter turbinis TaxID=2500533 RepID=A0A4P8EL78_9RHOB|nr:acyl-CoA dehydrogenase family protein [Pseudorhodobacter turbinis]QCO57723.1 acyl-CoA dehydrogenase [Pseudorhodobacter turbinis]
MTLTAAETESLARITTFAQQVIAPNAPDWAGAPAIFEQAAALGLTGIEVPAADGGRGQSYALKAAACEALAAADFGFAMSVVNTHNVAHKLSQCAPPAVKSKYLPALLDGRQTACTALTEKTSGSDFAAIEMRAHKVEGGWRLEGEKRWIINARHASLAIVYAQCAQIGDSRGIGAFVVDLTAPECTRFAQDSEIAQVSTGTGGFALNGVVVPDDHLLLTPGQAFKSILTEINGARTYVAAMCCGMLDAALETVSAYGQTRQSFGKPLAAHQGWRLPVARAETDLAAARALVAAATAQFSSGADAQLLSAQAKIHAVTTCQTHLPHLLHAMGAEGLRPEYPFIRHLGAAQIAGLADGSTEMLLERVAKIARPAPVK